MIIISIEFLTLALSIPFWVFADAMRDQKHPIPNCEEAFSVPLVDASMNCSVQIIIDNYKFTSKCFIFHPSGRQANWETYIILVAVPLNNLNRSSLVDQTYSLGMSLLSAKAHYGNYVLQFNSTIIIGVAEQKCQGRRFRNCSYTYKLRADVIVLPVFTYTLDDPLFWNFSSPLFRSDLRWLDSLHASAEIVEQYPMVLPGLAGSSVQEIYLYGSFGTDQKGPLPHFSQLPLLKTLETFNSNINKLPPDEFDGMELENVVILESHFQEIPKAFAGLKLVQTFRFHSVVQNFSLVPEVFDGMTFLITLNLKGTHIDKWEGEFPRLTHLKNLLLEECQMKIFNAALTDFPQLNVLSLRKNLLTFLTTKSLAGFPHLSEIYLNQNPFHRPNSLRLFGYPLQKVDVRSCNLTTWPELPRRNIKHINMSGNVITHLINLGNQIIHVQKLDISQNNISHWNDEKIFVIQKSNRENRHSRSVFNLIEIDIDSPRVKYLRVREAWVSALNLSNNLITTFSEVMLQSLNVLEEVDLGGNQIDCGNCQASLLQQWLATTTTRVKNLGENTRLTCSHPAHMRDHLVQEVDFDAVCFTPRRHLWLGMGLSIVGSVAVVTIVGGVVFYYRTEVAYLVHLAKVRSSSRRKNVDPNGVSYNAFICYSGKNRKWVMRRLVPLLERRPQSYVLCLFDRDFALGSHIVSNIVDAIEHSRKVIVVLTQHFIDSKWCQWELEMAQHKLFSEDRGFLVLLELEPLERRRLPRLLRFLLDTRPVVRWPRPETAPAVKAAAAELRRALGPSLRQNLFVDTPTGNEPRPTTSAADVQESLLTDEHTQGN